MAEPSIPQPDRIARALAIMIRQAHTAKLKSIDETHQNTGNKPRSRPREHGKVKSRPQRSGS
jgi:hypothetical protein